MLLLPPMFLPQGLLEGACCQPSGNASSRGTQGWTQCGDHSDALACADVVAVRPAQCCLCDWVSLQAALEGRLEAFLTDL